MTAIESWDLPKWLTPGGVEPQGHEIFPERFDPHRLHVMNANPLEKDHILSKY